MQGTFGFSPFRVFAIPVSTRRSHKPEPLMTLFKKIIAVMLISLVALFFLLAIPAGDPEVPTATERGAFTWNQDEYWHSLEAAYNGAVGAGCSAGDSLARVRMRELDRWAGRLEATTIPARARLLDSLTLTFFELGPQIAACPALAQEYILLSSRLREGIKRQSQAWDITASEVRSRLYRSLYGMRAAVEEVMLHHPQGLPSLLMGRAEPSATPSAMVQGVEIHSGDILISRGGYPTSALIARGNDYPGNFSHIALVHIDSAGVASTIEAHIERGVAISTAEEYLGDKKLRIMVLRPRSDLPALVADPMLPHQAATRALERARRENIPYDFAMNYRDPSKLFCSEVASAAYNELGLNLWMGVSTISNSGLRRWLASFGVKNFETQEPSDLEYDPQLVVVAEWRDPGTLFADHIDNAVIDAMLEGAERGDEIHYPWYQLPVVRIAKGYSVLVGGLGKIGPVPEGMSATAALRNAAFSARQAMLAGAVRVAADSVAKAQGYPPPYWRLLDLARGVVGR
jgi:hypothetical protein